MFSGCSRQQSDWQKTRETNTADAYEQFLKKYPSGEFTAQARARMKELYEESDWQKARDVDTPEAYQAFLKQYPEGKWTEEARIRVENFTLAQAPSGIGAGAGGAPVVDSGANSPADATSPVASPAVPAVKPAPSAKSAAAVKSAATIQSADQSAHATATSAALPGHAAYGVQLGAFKSGAGAAHERWARLQKTYPTVLAGLKSKVSPKKTATGSLYRLQVTGLTEKRARDLCGTLRARTQACVVVMPEKS